MYALADLRPAYSSLQSNAERLTEYSTRTQIVWTNFYLLHDHLRAHNTTLPARSPACTQLYLTLHTLLSVNKIRFAPRGLRAHMGSEQPETYSESVLLLSTLVKGVRALIQPQLAC